MPDILTVAGLLLGFSATVFTFRLRREVAMSDRGLPSHLPPSFILMGLSSFVIVITGILLPLLVPNPSLAVDVVERAGVASGTVLLLGYFVAERAHYSLLGRRPLFVGRGERATVIATILVAVGVALVFGVGPSPSLESDGFVGNHTNVTSEPIVVSVDGGLLTTVVISLISAVVAGVGALVAHRRWKEQQAWMPLFHEKRATITSYLGALDDAAQAYVDTIELSWVHLARIEDQPGAVLAAARYTFLDRPQDPVQATVDGLIPQWEDFQHALVSGDQARLGQFRINLAGAVNILRNILAERARMHHARVLKEKTTLNLTISDPEITQSADAVLERLQPWMEVPAVGPYLPSDYVRRWYRDHISPVKRALRDEIEESAKGFRQATRLDHAWESAHPRRPLYLVSEDE